MRRMCSGSMLQYSLAIFFTSPQRSRRARRANRVWCYKCYKCYKCYVCSNGQHTNYGWTTRKADLHRSSQIADIFTDLQISSASKAHADLGLRGKLKLEGLQARHPKLHRLLDLSRLSRLPAQRSTINIHTYICIYIYTRITYKKIW